MVWFQFICAYMLNVCLNLLQCCSKSNVKISKSMICHVCIKKKKEKDRKLEKIEENKGKSMTFILLVNKAITNYKRNKIVFRILTKSHWDPQCLKQLWRWNFLNRTLDYIVLSNFIYMDYVCLIKTIRKCVIHPQVLV